MLFLAELDHVKSGATLTPEAGRAFIDQVISPTLARAEQFDHARAERITIAAVVIPIHMCSQAELSQVADAPDLLSRDATASQRWQQQCRQQSDNRQRDQELHQSEGRAGPHREAA